MNTENVTIRRELLERIAQGCSCEVTTDALDEILAAAPAPVQHHGMTKDGRTFIGYAPVHVEPAEVGSWWNY